MQRQVIIDLQRQIHGAGNRTGLENGNHRAIRRGYVDRRELLLQDRHVRDGALGCGGHRRQDLPFREITGSADVDLVQAAFGDLQPHDLIRDVLLGNIDEHRAETAIMVGLLQRRSRGFHVGKRLMVPEQRVQRRLDIPI